MRSGSFSLLMVLLSTSTAFPREVHVANFMELLHACQTAQPGDIITIKPGVYKLTEVSRILIKSRPGPVIIKGATGNPADVIIEGQGQEGKDIETIFNLDDSPSWTFQDFTTRGTYYHGFKFDHASTDCALHNIVMRDHGSSAVKGTSDPSVGTYPDRLLVERCDIGYTKVSGGTRDVVEGIDGVGVNDWVIRNNRFFNIQRRGGDAYGVFTKGNSSNTIIEGNYFENCFIAASFGGGGSADKFFRNNETTYEHSNGIIRNNIMVRSTDAGIYINKGYKCKIYNNTLFLCSLTIQLRYPETTGWVRNNLVKRESANPEEPIVRIRDGATVLANEANLVAYYDYFLQPLSLNNPIDLHLKTGSRPIDAGVDVGQDVSNDFDGRFRPQGKAYDVGAYEFPALPSLKHRGAKADKRAHPDFPSNR